MSALKWVFYELLVLVRKLRVRLATQRKSLRKFNLPLLATTCESVWLGLKTKSPAAFSNSSLLKCIKTKSYLFVTDYFER